MKRDILKRRCPACKERGIARWRGVDKPVRCGACGRYFKFHRSGIYPVAAPFWIVLGNEVGVLLALVAAISAFTEPWSWWSAGVIGAVALFLGIPAIIPLREVEAPNPSEIQYSRRHRALQYLLIALPFLQFVLPFIGRETYQANFPAALALASIAAALIVYCAVLHGRYFYCRGVKRGGSMRFAPLPTANLGITLVFPVLWAWLSLIIFYLQVRREEGSLREIGLISLAAILVLTLLLLMCYWAGTRRRPSRSAFH